MSSSASTTSSSARATAWAMPSLGERFERARKPGAPQADVDVLLAGLAPDAPRELSTHEFASLLQQIIQDPGLSSRRDREGRLVLHVAAESMQALGPSYAQQLPAHAIPRRQLSPVVDQRIPIGLVLLVAVAVLEWLAFIGAAVLPPLYGAALLEGGASLRLPRTLRSEWQSIVYPGLVSLLPTLFTLWAWRVRQGELLQAAAVLLWISGVARLLLFALNGVGQFSRALPVFLLTGALTALAGFCFRPVWVAYRRKFRRAV